MASGEPPPAALLPWAGAPGCCSMAWHGAATDRACHHCALTAGCARRACDPSEVGGCSLAVAGAPAGRGLLRRRRCPRCCSCPRLCGYRSLWRHTTLQRCKQRQLVSAQGLRHGGPARRGPWRALQACGACRCAGTNCCRCAERLTAAREGSGGLKRTRQMVQQRVSPRAGIRRRRSVHPGCRRADSGAPTPSSWGACPRHRSRPKRGAATRRRGVGRGCAAGASAPSRRPINRYSSHRRPRMTAGRWCAGRDSAPANPTPSPAGSRYCRAARLTCGGSSGHLKVLQARVRLRCAAGAASGSSSPAGHAAPPPRSVDLPASRFTAPSSLLPYGRCTGRAGTGRPPCCRGWAVASMHMRHDTNDEGGQNERETRLSSAVRGARFRQLHEK